MDGIVVINKEKGCTSHDIVKKAKKIFGEKVGHTGTLDPNATGVLPLLIGQGTKLSYYLTNHNKEYVAILHLGIKTDTADSEGRVIEKKQVNKEILNDENVKRVLSSFLGKQKQVPPIYSAIKVKGKKLYEYARNGQEVEVKQRNIEIYDIKLKDVLKGENKIIFSVKCSKGTYIRSLCEDIAKKFGTLGYMEELERISVGEFFIENSITIEELESNKDNKVFLENHFISIEKFFQNIQNKNCDICLNKNELKLFLNGVKLTNNLPEGMYRIYDNKNQFIGIGVVKNNLLKREIIVENKN